MSTDIKIGIHLPHGVPGVEGATIFHWAKLAEQAGFSTLGVADRLVYDTADAVLSLAAAAAVTERIELLANIFIAPMRAPAVFAKEAATLSRFAPGRFALGIAGGARPQDYTVSGVPWERRGELVDECLDALFALNTPENPPHSLGPVPDPGMQILVGGASKPALRRMVERGHGYLGGGVKAEFMKYEVDTVNGAWAEAGREGEPRITAGTWFASEKHAADAARWLDTYLAEGGPPEFVRAEIAVGAEGIERAIEEYAAAGAGELVFFGCVDDASELTWLADTVADRLGA
ncbi:MAG: LLM class flavin-dependent oxidoreductase [Ilumatobacter sp.]|uniref:LLM class flavin-dependent oxidoreductase n=1 Tax=Ilumatobacter sp. TaxID=1967498 RepID=UPI003918BBE6